MLFAILLNDLPMLGTADLLPEVDPCKIFIHVNIFLVYKYDLRYKRRVITLLQLYLLWFSHCNYYKGESDRGYPFVLNAEEDV